MIYHLFKGLQLLYTQLGDCPVLCTTDSTTNTFNYDGEGVVKVEVGILPTRVRRKLEEYDWVFAVEGEETYCMYTVLNGGEQ